MKNNHRWRAGFRDSDPGAVYIVGGRAKRDAVQRSEWDGYQSGLILRLDLQSGDIQTCVEYVTPAEARPTGEYACLFKSATIAGEEMYVCTQTEVLIYQLPDFKQTGYITLPCFNDLHHVRPARTGNLLVVNTGLDMVLELTRDGTTCREWGLGGEDPWTRFSRNVDYRKVPTTKPHRTHPNYVFEIGEEVWVTQLMQRVAVCLTRPDRRIDIAIESPHDGHVHNGTVYFTTVDGHIVLADAATGKVSRIVDLNRITRKNMALGWCRGLEILDEDNVLVGFTSLRYTKFKENVQWAKFYMGLRNDKGTLPARIAKYDLRAEKFCGEYNLSKHGMSAVFSIHRSSAK